ARRGWPRQRTPAAAPPRSRLVIAVRAEVRFVVGPAASHLDPELEEDARVEQALELLARLGADPLQSLAAGADDHSLVGVPLDDDRCGDAAQVALLLVLVDDDGRG